MTITEVDHDYLLAAVPGHDLVVVSAVQSADGTVVDLDGLRAAAEATGVQVLLDVTQVAGWLPLRLDWADWVVGACYNPVTGRAAAVLPWLAGLDRHAVRDHCVGLADGLLAGLGLPPRGSAIVSLALPEDAIGRLTEAGVRSSARAGRARMAFHLYNTAEDVRMVLAAVRG